LKRTGNIKRHEKAVARVDIMILVLDSRLGDIHTNIQPTNRGAKENMKLKLIINPRHSKNIIRSSPSNTSSDFYTKRQKKEVAQETERKKERMKERNNRLIRCVYYFHLL
jgi:hypothetical protein